MNPWVKEPIVENDIETVKKSAAVFQPYVHDEPSPPWRLRTVVKKTGNYFVGLPFNSPDDLDEYKFGRYIAQYREALGSSGAGLICAPPSETVFGPSRVHTGMADASCHRTKASWSRWRRA